MQTDSFHLGNLEEIRLIFRVLPEARRETVTVTIDLTGIQFETAGDFWLLNSDLQLIAKCAHVIREQNAPQ